jgi:hypothetical protein
MTVRELIAWLQGQDQDARVIYDDHEMGYYDITTGEIDWDNNPFMVNAYVNEHQIPSQARLYGSKAVIFGQKPSSLNTY